nr:p24 protein [Tea plant necrotic ring blotch virus]
MASERAKSYAKMYAKNNPVRVERDKDFFGEFEFIFRNRILKNTPFIFSLLVVVFVISAHMDDLDNGPLGHLFATHKDNKLVVWILMNLDKFFGLLTFIPASICAPRSQRSLILIASAVCVIVLPDLHIWTYAIASSSMVLFINMKSSEHKVIVLAVSAFLLYNSYSSNKRTPAPMPIYEDSV